MTRKPRRLRFEDMLDEEGKFVIDGGDLDHPETEETPAPIGRPLDSTQLVYEDIDPFIDFYLLDPKRLTQRLLLDLIQHVYADKHGHPPSDRTLKERIRYLRSRR